MLTLRSKQLVRDVEFNHVTFWLLFFKCKSEARAQMDAYILSTVLAAVRAENVRKVLLKHNNLLDIHYDHFR